MSIKATCSGLQSESLPARNQRALRLTFEATAEATNRSERMQGRTDGEHPPATAVCQKRHANQETFFWLDMPLAQVLMRIVGRPLVEFKKPEPPVDITPKVAYAVRIQPVDATH
jgi:hypothetical protein